MSVTRSIFDTNNLFPGETASVFNSVLNRLMYSVFWTDTASVVPEGSLINEITQKFGGRTAETPQSYIDAVTLEYNQMLETMYADMHDNPHVHSTKSGYWSDPTVWTGGVVPTSGSVMVTSNHVVIYDLESDNKLKDVMVGNTATLQWDTTRDTRLWCDTLMSMGKLVMGTADAPIPESTTNGKPRAEIVFYASEAPGATERLGLMTSGPVRIHGAEKASRLHSDTQISAGATTVTLPMSGSNWRVGDSILFVATEQAGTSNTDAQYTGPTTFYLDDQNLSGANTTVGQYSSTGLGFHLSQDEVRTITSIVDNVVTFSPALSYNHKVYSDTLPHGEAVLLKPAVANLSRSIRLRSAGAADGAYDLTDLQQRAHTMFMHCDDVDVRYAEAKNMARTDTNPTLASPTGALIYNNVGHSVLLTNANNVRGRYAWHVHRTGAYFSRKQVILKGLTAWAPQAEVPQPGWAITHHSSRCAIEDCVVYNVRGAGMVSEVGNEIGQWLNNTVCWARGDGYTANWGFRCEVLQNHNGHQGTAYENQGRAILQQGNIASSSHFGWFYLIQKGTLVAERAVDEYSLRLWDPLARGGMYQHPSITQDNDTYGRDQTQIPDFNDNTCYGVDLGLKVSHRPDIDRDDSTPLISRRFHCINLTNAAFFHESYTYYYSFYDALWIGSGASAVGAKNGNVGWAFNYINIKLKNMTIGFDNAGIGLNYNGHIIDCAFDNVTTPCDKFVYTATTPENAEDSPYFGIMGPWTEINNSGTGFTATARQWVNLNSATDLPVAYPIEPWGENPPEPSPGTPKPYFYNTSSDVSITPTGFQLLSISGIIVDNVGIRRYPDHQSSESFPTNILVVSPRNGYYTDGTHLVLRNGCFNDNGTWKTRLWFVDHERLSGDYFQFNVDVTLVGFDNAFLLANQVDPETKHQLPLKPEKIPTFAFRDPGVGPTITSSATVTANNGEYLRHVLTSDYIHTKWTKTGGADSALFEVTIESGQPVLRWLNNGELSIVSDTSYSVQVTAVDEYGNSTVQNITVNGIAVPVRPFDGLPSPFGVYSTVLLLSSYTGPVVRVRRASDNTEQDFTAQQLINGTFTTFINATTGFVTTFYDQTGNGRNAVQATAANQAGIGTRYINGVPMVNFDGTNDRYTFGSAFDSVTQGANTAFFIGQPDATTGARRLFSSTGVWQMRFNGGSNENCFQHHASNLPLLSILPSTSLPVVGALRRNGTAMRYIMGAVNGSGNFASNITNGSLTLGSDTAGANCFDGMFFAFAVFSAAFSDAQMNTVGSYANTKIGAVYTAI